MELDAALYSTDELNMMSPLMIASAMNSSQRFIVWFSNNRNVHHDNKCVNRMGLR
jgi:hypothetical protein